MGAWLLRRVAPIGPTVLLVSVLVFAMQQLLPGDPALVLAGEDQDPAVIAYIRAAYNLDRPLPVRYALWLEGVVSGDFGQSIRIQRPVLGLIAEKLPVTAELAGLALVLALAIGIPAGVLAAVKPGTAVDHGMTIAALCGLSVPNFWLGMLLILLFSVELGMLPVSGYVSPAASLAQNLRPLIRPAFVRGAAFEAGIMRHTRSAMRQVLRADYIRAARA